MVIEGISTMNPDTQLLIARIVSGVRGAHVKTAWDQSTLIFKTSTGLVTASIHDGWIEVNKHPNVLVKCRHATALDVDPGYVLVDGQPATLTFSDSVKDVADYLVLCLKHNLPIHSAHFSQ